MPQISISVDGETEFNRIFKRFRAQFSDLTSVWEVVKDEFWIIEAEQFASEGGKGGTGKWQELSPVYAARKVQAHGAKPILQATGAMFRALTGQTGDTILNITRTNLEVGTSLKYAKHHYRGGGKLPQRKPISFSDKQKRKLQKRIQKELVRLLNLQGVPVS